MNSEEWARAEAGAWPLAAPIGGDGATTASSCRRAPVTPPRPASQNGLHPMALHFDPARRNGHRYALDHSDGETARLMLQARFVGPITRRLLVDAGIGPGMSVLDVGTGAGDVALIAADLVGTTGRVVGIDANPVILEIARERARIAGLANLEFAECAVERIPGNERFDAVVGRFVLLHVADPVAALRDLAGRLRPGGIVAVHEYDLGVGSDSIPPSPLLQCGKRWLNTALERVGVHLGLGSGIYGAFLDAGLPGPQLRMERPIGGGPAFPGYDVLAETIRSMLPRLVDFGIVTEEEVAIESFAARVRAEVGERGIYLGVPSIVAWTRTAA